MAPAPATGAVVCPRTPSGRRFVGADAEAVGGLGRGMASTSGSMIRASASPVGAGLGVTVAHPDAAVARPASSTRGPWRRGRVHRGRAPCAPGAAALDAGVPHVRDRAGGCCRRASQAASAAAAGLGLGPDGGRLGEPAAVKKAMASSTVGRCSCGTPSSCGNSVLRRGGYRPRDRSRGRGRSEAQGRWSMNSICIGRSVTTINALTGYAQDGTLSS